MEIMNSPSEKEYHIDCYFTHSVQFIMYDKFNITENIQQNLSLPFMIYFLIQTFYSLFLTNRPYSIDNSAPGDVMW